MNTSLIDILDSKSGHLENTFQFDFSVLSIIDMETFADIIMVKMQKKLDPFLKEKDRIWNTYRNSYSKIAKVSFYCDRENCSGYFALSVSKKIHMVTYDITRTEDSSGVYTHHPQIIYSPKDGPQKKKVVAILDVCQSSYQITDLISKLNKGDELIMVVCLVSTLKEKKVGKIPIISVQHYPDPTALWKKSRFPMKSWLFSLFVVIYTSYIQ